MKDKPILFSTPMVQAILEGRKTQTRRVVKPEIKNGLVEDFYHKPDGLWQGLHLPTGSGFCIGKPIKSPYQVGQKIWVRETWMKEMEQGIPTGAYIYKATDNPIPDGKKLKWKPSIFMPKKACRLWLECTNIRIERLKDISYEDMIAEGIASTTYLGADLRGKWLYLWDSINAKRGYGWKTNPWVWIIEFKKNKY